MLGRRDLLRILGLGALLPLASVQEGSGGSAERRVHLIDVPVAGLQFYEGMKPEVARSLGTGDPLILKREPENPHDEKAVEVYTLSGRKLGYLPRRDNGVIASLLDQGIGIEAELCFLDAGTQSPGYPWVRICQVI
jgi:hypothetical protein